MTAMSGGLFSEGRRGANFLTAAVCRTPMAGLIMPEDRTNPQLDLRPARGSCCGNRKSPYIDVVDIILALKTGDFSQSVSEPRFRRRDQP